jgi:hypothetical protein
MLVAAVVARTGPPDSAKVVMASAGAAFSGRGPDISSALVRAYVLLLLGERPEALAVLREYLTARPKDKRFVARHPWFRELQTVPAFRHLTGSAL